MPRSVLLVSGPNLGLLGQREPHIYGTASLDDHVHAAQDEASSLGLVLFHEQTERASRVVELVHAARGVNDAIIINPGAFTHYAWSIHDALAAFDGAVVELHLSNPATREDWRHTSVVSPVADGLVAGFGGTGYRLAVRAVAMLLQA
jgi:3-dehydroquinate dehydratase-2